MATRFKSVITLLAVVMVVATAACATAPPVPTPNIDATVEARVKQEAAAQPTSLPPTATPNLDATVEAKVLATIKAQPAATPYPTYTPFPTYTALPKPTSTPSPTATPIPTLTPIPTPTPAPTATTIPMPTPTPEAAMADMISVELLSKTVNPKNTSIGQYSDEVFFNFRFTNSSMENIRAFTGTAVFADIFARPFLRMGLTVDDPMMAKTSRDYDGFYLELNQFMEKHKKLKNSSMSDLIFSFEIESILFTDGTQLGSVAK